MIKDDEQISRPPGNNRNAHNNNSNQECKIASNKGDKQLLKPPCNDRNIHNNVSNEEWKPSQQVKKDHKMKHYQSVIPRRLLRKITG